MNPTGDQSGVVTPRTRQRVTISRRTTAEPERARYVPCATLISLDAWAAFGDKTSKDTSDAARRLRSTFRARQEFHVPTGEIVNFDRHDASHPFVEVEA